MDRLDAARPGTAFELGRGEYAILDFSMGACAESGKHGAVVGDGKDPSRLARTVWVRAGAFGNVCRTETLCRHMLSSR